jgi:hypothetical protein
MKDYDTHLLPEADGVNVTIELHVQGVSGISEITGDFELDVMYSEIWLDPRLSFKHLNVCTTNITLKSDFREKIWNPMVCFSAFGFLITFIKILPLIESCRLKCA